MNKEALHKLAAESLNEGLRLDDWDKIGCVNHDCDKCKAQQEPVAWQFFQGGKWHNGMAFNDHRKHTEAAGLPVRDLYPSPQAQPAREPLTFEEWLAKQHGDPEEIGFLQALRIAYIAGQDSITKGNT